jgi:hypothetical protein
MEKITDNDLAMFKERSRTELRSNCDVSRLAWDNVVPALCNEVVALRKIKTEHENMLKRCRAFLSETIQCGVEGEMLDGRHVNVAASDLADEVDDLLKLQSENAQCPTNGLTFGQAIDACRYKGEKIQRAEWNSADYVCFDKDTDCFVMDKDGVLLGWGTTQYDMAANDWMIVE